MIKKIFYNIKFKIWLKKNKKALKKREFLY